jgi:putative nucleotidyltransferase with HDIG domain
MGKPLRVLIVEDSEDDSLLLVRELKRAGYEVTAERVETADAMATALGEQTWDIVISDYSMPHFTGLYALRVLQNSGLDIPFIIVSGAVGEDTAVEAMKAGAHDFVMKSNLARLAPAIERELRDAQVRHDWRRAERALAVLCACNEKLVRASDEASLLRDICQSIVDVGGYAMAWIGFALRDPAKTVLPAACAGCERADLDRANITWADVRHGQSATSRAIRTGEPVIARDPLTNPDYARWPAAAPERGYSSLIALPLLSRGRPFGALTVCAADAEAFDTQEVKLLTELADDLAYGVMALRTRARREQAENALREAYNRLRKMTEGVIEALARMSELRDPYTAGHQQRVAQLAAAIAEELGHSQEQVEAVRVAGLLHDIGKVHVPAEILSKPGVLLPAEMDLVRTHVTAGCDILQKTEFPWQVTTIVMQHHERMNGSGYPSGLTGESICEEARILAVADVVEAMVSHRPFRPALGTDAACEEIRRNQGTLYDPAVVSACVRVLERGVPGLARATERAS